MIERAITEKDTNSSFYRHNEGLAKSWEEFVSQHGGSIEGMVNGFILQAEVNQKYKGKKIRIHFLRQLSNKTAHHSTGFLMTKNTVVEIESLKTQEKNWSLIRKNKILKLIYNLTKHCEMFSIDNRFMVVSKYRINESGIFDLKYWKNLSSVAEIRQINYSGGKIKIEFFNFLGPESVETVINEIMEKYSAS